MFSICEYYFHMQIKLTLIYSQNLAEISPMFSGEVMGDLRVLILQSCHLNLKLI